MISSRWRILLDVIKLVFPFELAKAESFLLLSGGDIVHGICPFSLNSLLEAINIAKRILLFGRGIIHGVVMSLPKLCHCLVPFYFID